MNTEQRDDLLYDQVRYLKNISGWATFGGIILMLSIAINILNTMLSFAM